MSTRFHHEPASSDMVTEQVSDTDTALLCVACGWEGVALEPSAPWYVFRTHQCRLSFVTHATLEVTR